MKESETNSQRDNEPQGLKFSFEKKNVQNLKMDFIKQESSTNQNLLFRKEEFQELSQESRISKGSFDLTKEFFDEQNQIQTNKTNKTSENQEVFSANSRTERVFSFGDNTGRQSNFNKLLSFGFLDENGRKSNSRGDPKSRCSLPETPKMLLRKISFVDLKVGTPKGKPQKEILIMKSVATQIGDSSLMASELQNLKNSLESVKTQNSYLLERLRTQRINLENKHLKEKSDLSFKLEYFGGKEGKIKRPIQVDRSAVGEGNLGAEIFYSLYMDQLLCGKVQNKVSERGEGEKEDSLMGCLTVDLKDLMSFGYLS